MATRSYKDAIDCLNSLQSNQATIEAARASGGRLEKFAMHETEEYLKRIGYSPQDLNRLNVIHVTGTKGKGSTCAFVDSLLRHSKPQWTVGLYTSPHLVAVRERIRVNGKPISEEDFARYFFEVWDRLEKNDTRKYESTSPKPMYFRMVTLVAFHAFSEMKVDATVLEVGVGGLYDCTNIIPKPVVTGVAALGIDHTAVLGNTLGSIAFQKGGIYKEGVPAFTVDQPKEGLEVLEQQAIDRKASKFTIVPTSSELLDIKLGLPGKHQYQNASLAVYLTQEFLRAKADLPTSSASTLSETFKEGLKNAKWPGRCQTVADPTDKGTTWFLDGAHTKDSIECCIRWFFSPDVGFRETSECSRVLVFNCTNDRNGASLLSLVLSEAVDQFKLHKGVNVELKDIFDHVIFTSNITYTGGTFKSDLTSRTVVEEKVDPLKVQRGLSEAWSQLVPEFPKDNVHVMPSVEDTVKVIRDLKLQGSKEVDVLVSGSLHLVGGIIEVANLAEIAL